MSEDDKKFTSFKDHVNKSSDRADHMAWRDEGCVEVHDDHSPTPSQVELERQRARRMQEDVGSWGPKPYPHLQNLPTSSYDDDHNNYIISSAERKRHYDHVVGELGSHYDRLHALKMYKGDSTQYNNHLRNPRNREQGFIKTPDWSEYGSRFHRDHVAEFKDRYEAADSLMSHKTGEDITSYRGVHARTGIHKLPVGATFSDHGYVGTSLKKNIPLDFAGTHDEPSVFNKHADRRVPGELAGHKIVAKIHSPAGTMGHFLDVDDFSEHHHEQEFALHRGTKFRIDKHEIATHPTGPIHLVHMTVIGQHPKKIMTPDEIRSANSPESSTAWERWHEKKFGFKPTWHKGSY